MKMSVREARAGFAAAIAAAERGEAVVITRNGKPVAQIAPPPLAAEVPAQSSEDFWARLDGSRKRLGLDKLPPDTRTADEWLEDFNDPQWTRELFGPEYFDDEPAKSQL